jgi:hypothetical protein
MRPNTRGVPPGEHLMENLQLNGQKRRRKGGACEREASTKREKRAGREISDPRAGLSLAEAADRLARSTVVRKLPLRLLARVERAVLGRASSGKTLDDIAANLSLETHGITPGALKQYARMLDELIRPVAAAQVMAGVLGCLPETYQRRILTGNQVLLLSKVAHILTHTPDDKIQSSELVKLAGVLRSAARHSQKSSEQTERKGKASRSVETLNIEEMGRAVRSVFGLCWPMSGKKSGQ